MRSTTRERRHREGAVTQFCIVKSQDEYFVTSLGHGVIRVSVVTKLIARKPVDLVGFVVNASFLVRRHLYANHVSIKPMLRGATQNTSCKKCVTAPSLCLRFLVPPHEGIEQR